MVLFKERKESKVMNNLLKGMLVFLMVLSFYSMAHAQDNSTTPTIVIKNHQFDPLALIVPAGKKLQITVDNQDPTAEEFESFDLDREQAVEGHKQIIVYLGPLKAGTYGYWGDFTHPNPKGTIVAQ